MGRPTKLDDLTARRIVDALEAGVSRRAAHEAARVSRAAFFDWLARGRDGEQPFTDFLERVEAAESRAERRVIDKLMVAIDNGHVPAMTFWLKARRREDWREETAAVQAAEAEQEHGGVDVEMLRSLLAAAESRQVG